jgi:WD40 repeat protein
MPLRQPSRTQSTAIPIFALKWHTSPYIVPKQILAYAGGGGSAKTGIGNTVQIEIDSRAIRIDTGVEIGVALDILVTEAKHIYVAVGISDSVKVYLIEEEAVEICSFDFAKGSGVNALAWNALGNAIVAGREDGKVCILAAEFQNERSLKLEQKAELEGHIKAVCSCAFHPRNPAVFMSSAKDGTCRVWNLGLESDDKCMETLECRIFDPNGKKPPAKILNPKPGQLLVRGCAFGDLDGKTIFTIQSGRKGGAFLSVWKLVRTPVEGEKTLSPDNPNGPPQQKFVFEFKESMRKQVSKYPVSAMSLSGDFSTLALGDTDGSVTLLSTAKFKPFKFFECVHDLPVTCIAARPLPLPLSGEDLTGVAVDAITASADNKICYVTKQRKSKMKPKPKGGQKKRSVSLISYLIYLLIFAIIIYVSKVSVDVCHEEFSGLGDIAQVKHCVFKGVLWAASDRPGVAFIPH